MNSTCPSCPKQNKPRWRATTARARTALQIARRVYVVKGDVRIVRRRVPRRCVGALREGLSKLCDHRTCRWVGDSQL